MLRSQTIQLSADDDLATKESVSTSVTFLMAVGVAVDLVEVAAVDIAVTPLGLSCYHTPSCTYILSPCVPLDRSYQTMTSLLDLCVI